jgi:hypothetical protein
VDYKAMLWQIEKDENCRYQVQIIWLRERDPIGEAMPEERTALPTADELAANRKNRSNHTTILNPS